METILSITEQTFKINDSYCSYEGWVISTTEQEIKIGIEDGQSCCENWGYLITNDTIKEFIGARLLNVNLTDTLLKKVETIDSMYEGDAMFVNIETDKGLLQFVAYNEHNGYYGHEAVVISKQLNHSEYL